VGVGEASPSEATKPWSRVKLFVTTNQVHQAMHKLNARSVPDVVKKLQQVLPVQQGAR
jgi:hypothetical protein